MNSAQPSWRVCDDSDPLSQAIIHRNQQDIAIALSCTPLPDECVDDVRSRLAVRLGVTESMAMHFLDANRMLNRFPQLATHLSDGHMCFEYLRRLAEYLEAVPDELIHVIEEDLLTAIKPKKPNQAVPLIDACESSASASWISTARLFDPGMRIPLLLPMNASRSCIPMLEMSWSPASS